MVTRRGPVIRVEFPIDLMLTIVAIYFAIPPAVHVVHAIVVRLLRMGSKN